MKSSIKKIGLYCFLTLLVLIYAFPILWVVLMSFKHTADAFTIPPKWFFEPTLENYKYIFAEKNIIPFLKNSFIICFATSIISILIGTPASYAYARYKSDRSLITLLGMLSVRMFPYMLMIIPFFVFAIKFGLFDTYTILILTYTPFNLVFAIWILRGFFKAVPVDVEEAAKVDGCSEFGAFLRVTLPNILAGLAATFFIIFLLSWNEFYMFGLILTSQSAKPLTIALAEYQAAELIEYWSWSSAIVTVSILPAIVLLILLRKYLILGFTFGLGEEK